MCLQAGASDSHAQGHDSWHQAGYHSNAMTICVCLCHHCVLLPHIMQHLLPVCLLLFRMSKHFALTASLCCCSSPDNTPQQTNSCDCGVFTLMFADYQSRNAPFTFDQRHMEYFRIRVVADIMALNVQIPGELDAEDSN